MRYFVTLGDREFPLSCSSARSPRLSVQGSEHERGVEILRERQGARPSLVSVDGRLFEVLIEPGAGLALARSSKGNAWRLRVDGQLLAFQLESELERRARPAAAEARGKGARVTAPMPGRVVKLSVRPGDRVQAGAALLSVEAMKMENELTATSAGVVLEVSVEVGATVEAEQELVVIAPES
jgi:biotin carboxyl carrier protein